MNRELAGWLIITHIHTTYTDNAAYSDPAGISRPEYPALTLSLTHTPILHSPIPHPGPPPRSQKLTRPRQYRGIQPNTNQPTDRPTNQCRSVTFPSLLQRPTGTDRQVGTGTHSPLYGPPSPVHPVQSNTTPHHIASHHTEQRTHQAKRSSSSSSRNYPNSTELNSTQLNSIPPHPPGAPSHQPIHPNTPPPLPPRDYQ